MERQHSLNAHMGQLISPWLGPHVLEAGSGYGAITRHLSGPGRRVTATDVDPTALDHLRQRFAGSTGVRVATWNIVSAPPPEARRPDTIVCVNVLEHIADESAALHNLHSLLANSQGRLVLIVPAHPRLYSPLDERLGHYRRYTALGLRTSLLQAGFEILHSQWFNFTGLLGWWWNATRKRDHLPTRQLALYRRIAPICLGWESRRSLRTGLSLVAIATPKRPPDQKEARPKSGLSGVALAGLEPAT